MAPDAVDPFIQEEWLHVAAPVLLAAVLAYCLGFLISSFIIGTLADDREQAAADFATEIGGYGHDA